MLAQIWGGGKTSTVDDFNPYQIRKRPKPDPRSRRVKLAELKPLLSQWVPKESTK